MSARMRMLISAVVLALAFGGYLFVQNGQKTPEAGAPASAATREPEAALPAMPSAQQPFSAQRDALLAHARAGNAEAAWRLAEGMRDCMLLASLEMAAIEDRDDTKIADLHRRCGGIEPNRPFRREWLKQAAYLGSTAAQEEYIADPELILENASTELEAWRDWRNDAPRYLDEAIARGETDAILMRANARLAAPCSVYAEAFQGWKSCRESSLLDEISTPDPVAAYADFLLARGLMSAAESGTLSAFEGAFIEGLTPEQISAAQAQAQQMRSRIGR